MKQGKTMKINMAQVFYDIYGKELTELENGEEKETTLGKVVCASLLNAYAGEENLSGDEKAKRYKLAVSIVDQDEVDLSIDEVKLIKDLVGKSPFPTIVGQAFEMLEGTKSTIKEVEGAI